MPSESCTCPQKRCSPSTSARRRCQSQLWIPKSPQRSCRFSRPASTITRCPACRWALLPATPLTYTDTQTQEDEVRLANAQGQPLRYKMALMVRIGEQSILKEAALELEQKLAKEQAFQKKRKGDSSAETKPKRKERHR